VPNDSPDYANTIATPAIDLGAFTVAANNLVTVYNGPVPAGCHALKVFVKGGDVRGNANVVTVIDPSDATVIQRFNLPKSTNLVTAVDDVSTPNIRVDVQATSTNASTGRVVAFLSDQAVTVDNDPNTAVPVTLGGVSVQAAPAGPAYTLVAVNTAGTLLLPSVLNQRIYLSTFTVSFNPNTGAITLAQVSDSVGGVIWEAYVVGGAQHFTFPAPLQGNMNANLSLLTTAPGAGISSIISATYGYGP
jgi:hypothetical protein